MNDLDLILNCDTKKHEYLFVQKGQLIKRKVSFCGRIFMWLRSHINPKFSDMSRIIAYLMTNNEKIFTNALNNDQKLKLMKFIIRIQKYAMNHSRFKCESIINSLKVHLYKKNYSLFGNALLTKDPKIALDVYKTSPFEEQIEILKQIIYLNLPELFKMCWMKSTSKIRSQECFFKFSIECACKDIVFYLINSTNIKTIEKDSGTPLAIAKRIYSCAPEYLRNKNVSDRIKLYSEEILKELEKFDKGFTDDLQIVSEFGHVFSLAGKFFEGNLFPNCFIEGLVTSLNSFSKNKMIINSLKLAQKRATDEILKQALENFVFLPTGWHQHQVSVIFTKNLCIKIDTSGKGIQFFTMGNKNPEVLKVAIEKLIHNEEFMVDEKVGSKFLHEEINKILKLEYITSLNINQTSGNCVWFSLKMALFVLFAFVKEGRFNDQLTKQMILEAYIKTKEEFESFETFDCIRKLKAADPILKKYPKLFNRKKKYEEVINYCIKTEKLSIVKEVLKLEPSLKSKVKKVLKLN